MTIPLRLPQHIPAMLAAVFLLVLLAFGFSSGDASAKDRVEHRPDLLRLFHEAGTTGTMVVRQSGARNRTVLVGAERSRERFLPSSTFKIPNALVALDLGVAGGADHVFPGPHEQIYVDGQPLLPEACLTDITLTQALRLSCVSVFQEIARQVGTRAYRQAMRRLDYGNRFVTGAPLDSFWLEGPFAISAREQVGFIDRLRQSALPYSRFDMAAVRYMMLIEDDDDYRLHAKTGYVFTTKPRRGWWVGYVERPRLTSVFALNLDVLRPEHLAARQQIGRAILSELGAFG